MLLVLKYISSALLRNFNLFIVGVLVSILSISALNAQIHIKKNDSGFLILDNGSPVIQFQRAVNNLLPEYARNNYFHPLYDLAGEVITEDFPADHPHQRGVFWSWHQVLAEGLSDCDPWLVQNFTQFIDDVEFSVIENGAGMLSYKSWWQTKNEPAVKMVLENSTVKVFPVVKGVRRIDFRIELLSLLPSLYIGGSDDEKGYGGFSIRMKTDSSTGFYGEKGMLVPINTAIDGSNYVNIVNQHKNQGVVIVSWDSNNSKAKWILRQKNSMQNCVWPGRDPVRLSDKEATVLNYSLLIHEGNLNKRGISKLTKRLK